MDSDLEIPSRNQDPSLKPLKPFVGSWASLHVNMTIQHLDQTLDIFIKLWISLLNFGYLYQTLDIFIKFWISLSNLGYLYQTLDIFIKL